MDSCANAAAPDKTTKATRVTCIQWNKPWRFLGLLSSEAFLDYLANQKCWVGYKKNLKMTYYKCNLSQHCPAILRTVDEKEGLFVVIYDNGKQHVHPDVQKSSEGRMANSIDWKLVHIFRDVVSASVFLDSQKYWQSSAATGSLYHVKLYNCSIAAGCPVMFKLVFDYEQNLAILYSNREEHSSDCITFTIRRTTNEAIPLGSTGRNNINAPVEDEGAYSFSESLHYTSVSAMEGIVSPRNSASDSAYTFSACRQQLKTGQSQHDDHSRSATLSSEMSDEMPRRFTSFWKAVDVFPSWNDAFDRALQEGPWRKAPGQQRRKVGIVSYLQCPNKWKNGCLACAAILRPNGEDRYTYFFGKDHLPRCKADSIREREAKSLALQRWHKGLSMASTSRFLQQRGFYEIACQKVKQFIASHTEEEPSCSQCNAVRVAKKARRDSRYKSGRSASSRSHSYCTRASSELERRRGNEPSSAAIFSPISTPSMNINDVPFLDECASPAVSESYQMASIRDEQEDEQDINASRSGNLQTEATDGERLNRALFESSIDQKPSRSSPMVRRSMVSRSLSSSLDSLSEPGVRIKKEIPEVALEMLHTVTQQNAWMKRELADLCAAEQSSDELSLCEHPVD